MKIEYENGTVETSNDDKVLYPQPGITKADVVEYYRDVAELMMPHLQDRFLTLHRFPNGVGEEGFYQQSRPDHFPDYVGGKSAPTADGERRVEHVIAGTEAALVYLADQAALALHGWLSRADKLHHPDRIVFDLDPADEGFAAVLDSARLLHEVLQIAGLEPFVMTTGSRGLHVVAPLDRSITFRKSRSIAKDLAACVAGREPERFTLEQRKKARKGRLYLDISRNAYGLTAIVPYSLRAVEEAAVATPLRWSDLETGELTPRRFHLRNIRRRLGQIDDPWSDFADAAARPKVDEEALSDWARRG